ncbi:hypothetical protein [Embleya hyalina]|uniref:DNA-binding protein n=1 Tax=Embleya hyalina TaxID=516124 RepID=A0A401YZ71_9ACTN|nr:hypothetical protein [Embleya hyalina]GCD99850.1 hypothetical protein EHYA_07572 [Embleya hyalina]
MTALPSDAELVKLHTMGKSDLEIAERYGVSKQAVNKRLLNAGIHRRDEILDVNDILRTMWDIKSNPTGTTHHSRYKAQRVKLWLRMRIGDKRLSAAQLVEARKWESRMRASGEVLGYDPETEEGWYYRPRTSADGKLVVAWPADRPRADAQVMGLLELPEEPPEER